MSDSQKLPYKLDNITDQKFLDFEGKLNDTISNMSPGENDGSLEILRNVVRKAKVLIATLKG